LFLLVTFRFFATHPKPKHIGVENRRFEWHTSREGYSVGQKWLFGKKRRNEKMSLCFKKTVFCVCTMVFARILPPKKIEKNKKNKNKKKSSSSSIPSSSFFFLLALPAPH